MIRYGMPFKSFKETLEKIESSEVFKNFKHKNPSAELCAGFFILDFLGNDNKYSLDYKLGEKIFTFNLDLEKNEILIQEDKLIDIPPNSRQHHQKLEKINLSGVNIELNELKPIAETKIVDNNIKSKLQKIIAILQNYNGPETKNKKTQVWNLTCILDSLIIINIIINSKTGEVLKFEKRSLSDMFKKSF